MPTSVWDVPRRSVRHELSKRSFIALLSFWVLGGLGVTAGGAAISYEWKLGTLATLLMAFVILGATAVAAMARRLATSFFAFLAVTLLFGLFLGPAVAQYTKASIINVLGTTTILCVGLAGIGVIYPKSLESWGIYLFGGLIVLIMSQFGAIIFSMFGFPMQAAFTWLDWLGIGLFSLCLIFDMNRAMHVERTITNSVACALAVYLDIINIFLRLLSQNGSKND